MRRSGSTRLCVATWTCALAGTAEAASQSNSPQPLQEVTVTATRVPDHAALVHAINGFVASHSAPSTRINQLGRQLARYPLNSVADYLAMVSLTRMAQLDQCAPLPSITDLLARGCAQPVADLLTAADRAYLTALYSADLEQRINLERGEVRDQMVRQIEGK